MDQVLNQLDREEPNYVQAARLGEEALPHLITLIQGDNAGLASKAAYLAGFINAAESAKALEIAARHPDPVVRIAAAASARNLTNVPTSLALDLLNDSDVGVRKWTLKTLEVHRLPGARTKVEEIMNSDPNVELRNKAKKIINQLS
jgi:HEAT repeat protein